MEFNTQAEVLEYIGKNPNDRSLIQRMIIRWELSKKDWKYYLVDKDTRIKELEKELNMYKECYNKNAEDYNRLLEEYEEYKRNNKNNKNTASSTPASSWDMADLEYLNNEYIKLEENREQALRKCYEFMVDKKIFDKEKNPFEDFFYRATWEELT